MRSGETLKAAIERGPVMNLTLEQERAIQNGQAVIVTLAGAACVVLRKDIYERGEAMDYSSWMAEEMDLLAAETADMLAGDGFDEPAREVEAGPISAAQRGQLELRLADSIARPEAVTPWEVIKARALARARH
jgi:hypothetical protein